jgi:hypothetical protein
MAGKPSQGQRVSVRLDPGMVLEGLILARLAAMPRARQQEWLRMLLGQGYLWESRMLREARSGAPGEVAAAPVAARPNGVPRPPLAGWLGRPAAREEGSAARASATPPKVAEAGQAEPAGKPFAQLRKIIG